MARLIFLVVVGSVCTSIAGLGEARAQSGGVQWIWFDEGEPAKEGPAGTRYFRRVFKLDRAADEGILDITADDRATVWFNGEKVGSADDWKKVRAFDVRKHMVVGDNVIAVEAVNAAGPAGLLVRLGYIPNGQSKLAVVSDGTWKASKEGAEGWQKLDFNDGKWLAAKVLGPARGTGTWTDLTWESGGDDRFSVPPGFKVEMAVQNPDPKDPFSLINLCFDAKGRLLVSQEGTRGAYKSSGFVLLCTKPDKNGVFQNVKPYCTQVTNCQGMCWVKDALLLVGNGPDGTGLYRVRDTNGDDQTDEVKLLHKFKGGMGEHGPHAIVHGPDGFLYLMIGNHAWAQPDKLAANSPLRRWPKGDFGPDQGQPKTTEDVLLPRLNDARGHAADILAPGGTIWRMDLEGKNLSLVTAGFRNAYDLTFSPTGELFTCDSDMEWDEALPWYRQVRVCHCPPGADFVWRTGAANTPEYYIDSLPPIAETGRGSPVGVEYYDHIAFPEKYRTLFVGDWAIGVIFAVHLERNGASYKTKVEKFCTGTPMNVTDLAVGPDGDLYFTMGGRGTQGGVYRIVWNGRAQAHSYGDDEQPLAAFARDLAFDRTKEIKEFFQGTKKILWSNQGFLEAKANKTTIGTLFLLNQVGVFNSPADLLPGIEVKDPQLRAYVIYLLGLRGFKEGQGALIKVLKDEDPLVRRRACEALIRAGVEPPVADIYPQLGDPDRFVRTAARLVIERIDPKKWADRLWKEAKDEVAFQGIVALCKTHQAAPYAEPIFQRLRGAPPTQTAELLDYLRTVQLALIHCTPRPIWVAGIAKQCDKQFPHSVEPVSRELAILLTQFRREGIIQSPVHAKLLKALLAADGNRQLQIHYFYCLRFLHEGWTPEQKQQLLAWYESTKSWTGGHSYLGFLENMLRDAGPVFTGADRTAVIAQAEKMPWAAVALLRQASAAQLPEPASLADLYARLQMNRDLPRGNELKEAVVALLGRYAQPEAQAALRQIGDTDTSQRDTVARALARFPTAANWPYLVKGLDSGTPLVLVDVIQALGKSPLKPKMDDGVPYRALLLASSRLQEKDRWKVVELLRQWSGKSFGGEPSDWKAELTSWGKWFNQSYPKETPLPDVAADKPVESKYKLDQLAAYLEKEGRQGDVARGRLAFEKAQCMKCHKFGTIGEGLGPDLTALSKRFKRIDIVEATLLPSKVISDQYRSVMIVTKNGQSVSGLAAPQGDLVTILQSDGTKLTLRKEEIEQQVASLVSVMPEKLLDLLTLQEIADLFAFLESTPK